MLKGFTEPQTAQLSLGVARRLNHFVNNWKVITTDKCVLDCVQGFQIPFSSLPSQEHWPNSPISSTEQSSYPSAGQHATRERGNHLSEKPFRLQEFLLNSLPCSQEGRSDEASNQSQEAERMDGTPGLQNGGYGDT